MWPLYRVYRSGGKNKPLIKVICNCGKQSIQKQLLPHIALFVSKLAFRESSTDTMNRYITRGLYT